MSHISHKRSREQEVEALGLDRYLTIGEVADLWGGVTTKTVRAAIASGALKARRLPGGRKLLVRASDAEAALVDVPTDSAAS